MKKKLFCTLLTVLLITSNLIAYAQDNHNWAPYASDEIYNASVSLVCSGNTLSAKCTVTATSSTCEIDINLQFQKLVGGKWTNFGSEIVDSSSNVRMYSKTHNRSTSSSGTYRAVCDFTVTVNGSTDTITKISQTVTK